MAEKPNPFDVEALEKSLNDSATRVSTIWISFLVFGAYLVVAAGTVPHRQLLLEDPLKLPALNIEMPLVGFFFLTPILFVVLHLYVLIQVTLLGRTAAAYNEALDGVVKSPTGNASMRQRLANTLFAQLFAGSPREREGWFGWLLKMMAWLTLAIAPVLVLLVFQFKFLPYHSHLITWTLRLLIAVDLTAVLVLWRGAFGPARDLVRQDWSAVSSVFALTVFSWIVLTFPGEPHAQWTRYWPNAQKPSVFDCQTVSVISKAFPGFDRLSLTGVDAIDEEKFAKNEKAAIERKLLPYKAKRTRSFRDRDLTCAAFTYADLRGVDLTGAMLRGAYLFWADLEGAVLDGADFQGAGLHEAKLQGASLQFADLRSAYLGYAQLQHASLAGAKLQGADLTGALLHNANLYQAHLQGADLSQAQLQGALLREARLQGASLDNAKLQVASLDRAQLQGASLNGADLSAASLESAGIQGADFNGSVMQSTQLSATYVWRARNAACKDAAISGQLFDALLPRFVDDITAPVVSGAVPITPDTIEKFIEESVAGVSNAKLKEAAMSRMRSGLKVDPAKDDTPAFEAVWRTCEQISRQVPQADFGEKTAAYLHTLFCDVKKRMCAGRAACDARGSADAVAMGILRNWISYDENRRSLSAEVGRGLLGEGAPCAASKELDEELKERVRDAVEALSRPATASQPN